MFRQYHYLNDKLGAGIRCYVAIYQNEPIAFIVVAFVKMKTKYYRVSRLVVLPDYQGIGIGKSLLSFTLSLRSQSFKFRRLIRLKKNSVKKTGQFLPGSLTLTRSTTTSELVSSPMSLPRVRNMEILIISAILEIEQIVFRLRAVSESEDAGSTIGSVIGILRSVGERIVSVFPEAENELCEISNMLSEIIIEVGQNSGMR
jgi:hypothetical protein